MKKVVALVLAVLVATMLSAQVFASDSVTSNSILVYPDPKAGTFLVVPYADRANYPGGIEDTLNAAYAELQGKDASKFGLDAKKFEMVLLFDARPNDSPEIPEYFEVKVGLNSGDEAVVFHRTGVDTWVKVDSEVNGSNVKIKGVTDFSAFVVLKSTSSSQGTSPATGDQMIAVYGVGALVFTAAAVLLLRKRENA